MFHHCLHLRGEIFRSHLKLPITQIPTKMNSNEKFCHALVNVTTILPIVISTEQTRIVEFILTLQPTSHTLTHITLNGMSCLHLSCLILRLLLTFSSKMVVWAQCMLHACPSRDLYYDKTGRGCPKHLLSTFQMGLGLHIHLQQQISHS